MKMLIYGILIAAALAVPTRTLELGKLKPVEVIRVDKTEETIRIETDTGDSGEGGTVNQAIWDLQETTAGRVYLDTAEYLLVGRNAQTYIPDMNVYLKDNVRICAIEGELDLKEAARYLDSHRPQLKMSQWSPECELETLIEEDERLVLTKTQ